MVVSPIVKMYDEHFVLLYMGGGLSAILYRIISKYSNEETVRFTRYLVGKEVWIQNDQVSNPCKK